MNSIGWVQATIVKFNLCTDVSLLESSQDLFATSFVKLIALEMLGI